MWSAILSRPEWRAWLLEVAGGQRVRPGVRLDPFGTSWRVLSTQARRWLPLIRAGKPIEGSKRRADQAIIDLRAANLVASPSTLTDFGEAVLGCWSGLPDSWEFELPLGVALLQEAVKAEQASFKDMLAFWWDIRHRFGDEEPVLVDGEALLLFEYLNRAVGSFNPWVELRCSRGAVPLPVPWDDLESAAGGGSAVSAALGRLRRVLDPARRLKGRVVFCRAMSLLFLRRENPAALDPYLTTLRLLNRSERA